MLSYPQLAAIRLGYGLSPLADPPADPQALVRSVGSAGPDARSFSMARDYRPHRIRNHDLNQRKGGLDRPALKRLRETDQDLGMRAPQVRIARAVDDRGGFGERLVMQCDATVDRAGPLRRTWTAVISMFQLTELYEVGFEPKEA